MGSPTDPGKAHLRFARPSDAPDAVTGFYRDGLGSEVLPGFGGHGGFEGVMLGHSGEVFGRVPMFIPGCWRRANGVFGVALLLCSTALGTEVQESLPTAKYEVKVLMDEGFPLAQTMLRERGELSPFAVVMTIEGQIEQRSSQGSLDSLITGLHDAALNGRYKAVAIFVATRVTDPRTNKKIDAVEIGFEHIDGYCGELFVPYTLPLEKLDLGEVIATRREASVFGECP